jgi:hypothetical protein
MQILRHARDIWGMLIMLRNGTNEMPLIIKYRMANGLGFVPMIDLQYIATENKTSYEVHYFMCPTYARFGVWSIERTNARKEGTSLFR